jgi:hypothetical protein
MNRKLNKAEQTLLNKGIFVHSNGLLSYCFRLTTCVCFPLYDLLTFILLLHKARHEENVSITKLERLLGHILQGGNIKFKFENFHACKIRYYKLYKLLTGEYSLNDILMNRGVSGGLYFCRWRYILRYMYNEFIITRKVQSLECFQRSARGNRSCADVQRLHLRCTIKNNSSIKSS